MFPSPSVFSFSPVLSSSPLLSSSFDVAFSLPFLSFFFFDFSLELFEVAAPSSLFDSSSDDSLLLDELSNFTFLCLFLLFLLPLSLLLLVSGSLSEDDSELLTSKYFFFSFMVKGLY